MTSNNEPGIIATALAPYPSSGTSKRSNVIPFPATPTNWPEGWRDWKKTAALKDLEMESAGDGIEPEIPPLDFPAVRKNCAFINEAVEAHGKDFDQTRWRYTTLMATAFEGGQELAQEMASGHPEYTKASTDELWDRSKGDTEQNPTLAWVGCDKIQAAGCKSCATCPHLAAGKSPLHLGLSSQPQAERPVEAGREEPPKQMDAPAETVSFADRTLSSSGLHFPSMFCLPLFVILWMQNITPWALMYRPSRWRNLP